jgi:hypothetical protein
LRVFYKSLWLHVLLVKVINQLYQSTSVGFFEFVRGLSSVNKKPYKPDIAKEYLESYKDNFFNDSVVNEITEKMQTELSGKVNFEFLGATGKATEESIKKVQRETSSYVSKELIRKQKELIKVIKEEFSDNRQQVKAIISIDDLDKSWLSSSGIRYDFINALLEAFKELLDVTSVKILISIRTDILMGIYKNNLRQDEKDQSLIYAISWNRKEIREILDLRIAQLIKNQYSSSKVVTLADIFNFTVNEVKADEFIINRTMLRPRDAIDFVNSCLAECDGNVELNEDIVLEAEEKYYSKRKNALVKEWQSIFPCIKEYLDAISFMNQREFTSSELASTLKDNISNFLLSRPSIQEDELHTSRSVNFEELLKVWFTVGIIGIKKSQTLLIYSSFEKQELDITDLNKTFCIHPLFYRQ